MLSRRATPVSPAVRAVGGVNVGPPPPAPPAIRSPTAVPASPGPGAATASAACRGTGTTAPRAAKVSLQDQSNILSAFVSCNVEGDQSRALEEKAASTRVPHPRPRVDVRESSAESGDLLAC